MEQRSKYPVKENDRVFDGCASPQKWEVLNRKIPWDTAAASSEAEMAEDRAGGQ